MSFYILMLSIFLLLQRDSRKLETLLLLGYSPVRVARPYRLLTLGLNLAVWAVALGIWMALRGAYLPLLGSMQETMNPAAGPLRRPAGWLWPCCLRCSTEPPSAGGSGV